MKRKDFWNWVVDILTLEGRYDLARQVSALSTTSNKLSGFGRIWHRTCFRFEFRRRQLFAVIEEIAQTLYRNLVELYSIVMGCDWNDNVAMVAERVEGYKMLSARSVSASILEKHYRL